MKTRIIVDSTLDMTESFCRSARVIPLTIHFGQEVLTDGVTITRSQFYERLVSVEAMPTTSQPSPAAFEEAYEEIARAGESAVVITISSKLSGTCQSAQIAAEGYDNIYVVDSQNAANGAGILAEYAILCAEKGMAAPELAAHLKEETERLGLPMPRFLMEPGRSIVADAGMTLYTVGSVKCIPGYKQYAAVDGGMTDNPRYALYQSRYTVYHAHKSGSMERFDVVGRCCESGDIIQPGVELPGDTCRGDILAVCTTGAYNYSMASNYNRLPRPAVVMLTPDRIYEAVRRETFADLTALDL